MDFRGRTALAVVSLSIVSGFAARACLLQAGRVGQSTQQAFLEKLSAAAIERTHHVVRYDPKYVRIPYRGGDVPADTGVCSDEVIRAYRALGIDLQKEVHEDIVANFSAYPNQRRWLLAHPDSNIDHRRGPNPMVCFYPQGTALTKTNAAGKEEPGGIGACGLGCVCADIRVV